MTFKDKFCKYVFRNLALNMLSIFGTPFTFMNISSPTNSDIRQVAFVGMTRMKLATELLDPDVFKLTATISISETSLYNIQPDLFQNRFNYLLFISLELMNLRGFLHTSGGLAWIKYLNYDSNKTISSYSAQKPIDPWFMKYVWFMTKEHANVSYPVDIFPFIGYQFPDSDFCLFNIVPMERLVFVQINGLDKRVSCTVAWLYKYQDLYDGVYLKKLDHTTPNCNLSELERLCHVENVKISFSEDPYFIFYDLSVGLNRAKTVLMDYIKPGFSIFGFVTNSLAALTILYNQKRRHKIRAQAKGQSNEIVLLEQFFFKYILINSVLNSLYTLMYFLDSVVPCDSVGFIKNSRIHFDNCIVKSIYLSTIGSVLKLVSNFSFLQISTNRYLLVGKDHPEWLIKISKITIKRFFLFTMAFSLALSSIVYFQISFFVVRGLSISGLTNLVYEGSQYDHYYYLFNYNPDKSKILIDSLHTKLAQLPLLSSFSLIHDLFSYFLFCLFSLILDILTVKKLRDSLREKEKIKGNQENKKNRESERKGIMMIVSNSLVNFLFRAPEVLSVVFFYTIINDGGFVFKMVCFGFSSCLTLVDFSNVFYIMSLCFNLFFYIKFNLVFRCSFVIFIRSSFGLSNKWENN